MISQKYLTQRKAEDMHAGMDCHQAALSKEWSLGAGEEYENRDLCNFK